MESLKVPYFIVVEEQEYDKYAQVIKTGKVLILDKQFQKDYDTFDNLGDTKSKGPGPARNFVWDHAIKNGFDWHWVMDDNIRGFYRFNKNLKVPVADGTIFRCMEDFCLRYENIGMAGPNYQSFIWRREQRRPPFLLNTRIYSCNLIRNDIPWRWRGRYNEDTDLSLRILKGNMCTVQFNAFLQGKVATQTIKGGNTEEFYRKEGTLPKSKMLVLMHPDVSRMNFKYGRYHHYVAYRVFKTPLKRKPGVDIDLGINEYGMKINEPATKAKKSPRRRPKS